MAWLETGSYHAGEQAEADQHGAEQGDGPVLVVLGGPAVDEEAGGDAGGGRAGQEEGQAVLGLHGAARRRDLAQRGVRQLADQGEPEDHADADADVGQPDGARAEAVPALEDEGEGGEEQVQDAVRHGDVQRHQPHDGAEEEHLGRPDDGPQKQCPVRHPRVQLAAERCVARGFAQTRRLVPQERGCVRLAEEDEACDGDRSTLGERGLLVYTVSRWTVTTHQHGKEPEHPLRRSQLCFLPFRSAGCYSPPPALRLNQESTADRTNHRPQQGAH